jgi:lipoprotein-anchoring transpeptidase ErfK/SrfK
MRTNKVRALGALAAALALLGVTACSSGRDPMTGGGTAPEPSTTGSTAGAPVDSPSPTPPPPAPVVMAANVADKATKVTVDTLVKVTAKSGTLSSVKVAYRYTDRNGKTVKGTLDGALSKDKAGWTAAERLEPAAAYAISMTGKNAAGESRTARSSFTTHNLSLDEQTYASIYPQPDSTVGIGMPVVLTFDVPVKDKKEFQKNLQVTASPAQTGTWNWFSDTQVRFRPAKYWKPGTKVKVKANLNGVKAGNGVYGQKSVATSFTVGRSLVTKVNLASDVAKVYRNGKLVKTIYVSGGKPGWETRSGVKLIMAKEYNKKMTNEMIGAKEDYSLTARHALRITNSGEFLHSAPWNTAHFGRRNASHGCVGMSNANAAWLYNNTLIGDPVITTGSRRGVEQGNGYSDWNISFAEYKKGSAL